ncbi:MAG: hypothetical protein LBR50_03705 [Tannerella sp.]|jgi:hypothetical protein|nr:hypothetical protein [Tannerella sp.]
MKVLKTTCLRNFRIALIASLLLTGMSLSVSAIQPRTVIYDISVTHPIVINPSATDDPVDYVIVGSWNGGSGVFPVTVRTGYSGTITLKDATIRTGDANCNAFNIEDNAYVTLKLMGTNVMGQTTNVNPHRAAIFRVAPNGHLTIESYDGIDSHGSITVTQTTTVSGAAIGSNYGTNSGYITINSGTVIATGGDDSAGIGGGSGSGGVGGAGGHITINGGIVRATCDSTGPTAGTNSGAAIGAGSFCEDGTYILITGGDVTASSLLKNGNTLCGAAIGAGNRSGTAITTQGKFKYIIITGGKIKASVKGLFDAAGNHIPPQIINGAPWTGGFLDGRDGVGIGGGAYPEATGTIIILPSADVSEVYGGTTTITGAQCWDVGNCDKIFYLNKAKLRVSYGTVGLQNTSAFTAKLNPDATGADVYAKIQHLVDLSSLFPELASLGSLCGTTVGANQIVGGLPDTLNYYTNSAVDFFTDYPSPNPLQPYQIYATTTMANPSAPSVHQSYNPKNSTEPTRAQYNVVLGQNPSPSYNFLLSTGWAVAPTAGTPSTSCTLQASLLDFGTATYNRYGPNITSGSSTKMSVSIANTGNQWLNVKMDPSSNVRYFDLEGPIVADPPFSDAASIPNGTTGTITATLRNQVPVGTLIDTVVLKATDPTGQAYTRYIYLKIQVNQQLVTGSTNAKMQARNPDPPALITDPPVKTNSTVRLNARAGAPDIDGVKKVWYKISSAQVDPDESRPAGWVPTDGTDGWTAMTATPVDGKLGYNFLLGNIAFPQPDGVYYIHWFVETVNTIGSRSGVLGPYDVNRNKPAPTISPATGTIGGGPVELTITFADVPNTKVLATNPASGMFSVTNGSIVGGVTTVTPGKSYKFYVQANGSGNVSVEFPANNVDDEYGNYNIASNIVTLTLNNGTPMPNFSTVDTVYFTPQPSITFSIASGDDPVDHTLFKSDGTTVVNSANALTTFTLPAASSVTYTSVYPGTNDFNVVGPFNDGVFPIYFAANSIKNHLGTGILDTTYTFKVYNIGIGIDLTFVSPSYVFPSKNEGYGTLTPNTVTVTNLGSSMTLPGLNVTLGGANPSAFALNTSGMLSSLPGGSSTTCKVAPVTGLTQGTYTADIIVQSYNRVIGTLSVTFTVTKLPAPNAIIDYVNETLINISNDTAYVFNDGSPVKPVNGAISIPESWMNDVANGLKNEAADPANSSARSLPQYITVPRRPAAPVLQVQEESGTGFADGLITGVTDAMQYRTSPTGDWIDIPAGFTRLDDLPGGVYYIRYKAIQNVAFASYTAVIEVITRNMPSIMREIIIPYVEGVTTTPAAGAHQVASGDDFAFTLTFNGRVLKVATDRVAGGSEEALTGVKNISGGYDYIIHSVRENIKIVIGPETVGNENIDNTGVWAYEGAVCIEATERTAVDIYSINGVLVKRMEVAGGITTVPLAKGVYIVVLPEGETHKVIVK